MGTSVEPIRPSKRGKMVVDVVGMCVKEREIEPERGRER